MNTLAILWIVVGGGHVAILESANLPQELNEFCYSQELTGITFSVGPLVHNKLQTKLHFQCYADETGAWRYRIVTSK